MDPVVIALSLMPATRRGVSAGSVSPAPASPNWLSPQQYASPPLVSAHACQNPRLIDEKRRLPATRVGAWRGSVSPTPICPRLFSPQQYAVPEPSRPQANLRPTLIDARCT